MLQAAKDAADVLIREMLAMGLGRPQPKAKREDADFYSSSEDEDEENENQKQGKHLVVEQIKVEDDAGNLKVAYPAKTDLKFADEAVDKGLLEVRRA